MGQCFAAKALINILFSAMVKLVQFYQGNVQRCRTASCQRVSRATHRTRRKCPDPL
jgi:hypothetical protein